MGDGHTAEERSQSTELRLDRMCTACHRGNLSVHAFCGWCGERLPAIDAAPSDQFTLLASDPCESGAMTVITAGEGPRNPSEAEITMQSGIDVNATHGHESTDVGAIPNIDGVAVVLLGRPEAGGRSQSRTTYRLELGEPFDVAAQDLERPATFTATVQGLRFEALGDLDGVYIRVRSNEKPIAFRRLRVQKELGAFQAVAPGETLRVGSLAIIGDALVRIEAITT